jgi:hypothetical protein
MEHFAMQLRRSEKKPKNPAPQPNSFKSAQPSTPASDDTLACQNFIRLVSELDRTEGVATGEEEVE